MATYISTKETTNYARLSRAVVGLSSDILRDVLESKIKTFAIHSAALNKKKDLRLSPLQWNTIKNAPTSGYGYFDITLLYPLLRYVSGLGNPTKGWGQEPDQSDVTIQDDIERIRILRNKAYAHTPTANVSDPEFKNCISLLHGVCTRMDGHCPGKDYVKHLNEIETCTMDPVTEQIYTDNLKDLCKREKDMSIILWDHDHRLEEQENRFKDMSVTVDATQRNIYHVSSNVEAVQIDVHDVSSAVEATQKDVQDVSRTVNVAATQKELKDHAPTLCHNIEIPSYNVAASELSSYSRAEEEDTKTRKVEDVERGKVYQNIIDKLSKEKNYGKYLTDNFEKFKDPNNCDGHGWGLLHIAAFLGDTATCKWLISKGLDVDRVLCTSEDVSCPFPFNKMINMTLTPLGSALHGKNQETFAFIIKHASVENIKMCFDYKIPEGFETDFFSALCDCRCLDGDTEKYIFEKLCKQYANAPVDRKPNVVPGRKVAQGTKDENVIIVYSKTIFRAFNKSLGTLSCVFKNQRSVNSEAVTLTNKNETYSQENLSKVNAAHVKSIIQGNSSQLWANHSNLNIISASAVKSKKSGNETCKKAYIVLYCSTKGVIPHGEEAFPKELEFEGVVLKTDIREGYFELGVRYKTKSSTHHHDDLKMGCEIGADKMNFSGTLGPFVEIPSGTVGQPCSVGFLTCHHVIHGSVGNNICANSGQKIYHPPQGSTSFRSESTPCGEVWKTIFNNNEANAVSVDCAAVKIKDPQRMPLGGYFALNKEPRGAGFNEYPCFQDGRILEDLSKDAGTTVCIKFGCETHLTRGLIIVDGTEARTLDTELGLSENETKIKMKGQIEIGTADCKSPLFVQGDSGAGVFLCRSNERNDAGDPKLHCIGMAIGFTWPEGTMVLTPIRPILNALGIERLWSFEEAMEY